MQSEVLDKKEVLRYMGVRGEVSPQLSAMIDQFIAGNAKYLSPRHIMRESDIIRGKKLSAGGIELEGKDIIEFLDGADKCCLLCATVGADIEREIEKAETQGPLAQVILDAIGTAAVEALCDRIALDLGEGAARFSPGYGDFPLSVQPEIINTLNATKLIGVSVTDTLMLTPRKSVTAIVKKVGNGNKSKHAIITKPE